MIAPALLMLNETRADALKTFVENGGQLVLTIRSGMKDDYNALLPQRQPGALAEIAGIEVEDYYALLAPAPVSGAWFNGTSRQWAERLKIIDEANVQVIARFGESNGWLDGQAAVTFHPYGKGAVYFIGAYLDDDSQQVLLDRIARAAAIQPVMSTPAGVEVRKRMNIHGEEIYIVINHERRQARPVPLPWPAREHLTGRTVSELELEPYGVAVVTRLP